MESQQRFEHEARVGEFRRRIVRHVQCRSCGYEPPRGLIRDRCPKCGGGCWEKFVRIGKLRPDPPAARAGQLRRPSGVATATTATTKSDAL